MDDFSLGSVESAALTQGIAFLYAQAGELLRRRRAAREQAKDEDSRSAPVLPVLQLPEAVFLPSEPEVSAAEPQAADRLADSLRGACRDVTEYLAGEASLADGTAGLAAADRLRCLLEEVYGAQITFRGEHRADGPPSATRVRASQIGVLLSGDARVYGDIAGRDIINKK